MLDLLGKKQDAITTTGNELCPPNVRLIILDSVKVVL